MFVRPERAQGDNIEATPAMKNGIASSGSSGSALPKTS